MKDSFIENSNLDMKQAELIYEKMQYYPVKTQLATAIIQKGEVKFCGIERKKDSIVFIENHNSVFEIGSITKVFTSTLLASLVLNEMVNIDDEINDYLDFGLKSGIKFSFKELANHTSGLPPLPSNICNLFSLLNQLENPYKNYDNKKLEEYLKNKLKLKSEPGKKMQYSNLGLGILGYLLEKISNSSYQDLLENNILSKYSMNNTTINRQEVGDNLVKGLNTKGKEVLNWDFKVLVGAGGILSTVEDLSKFVLAQSNIQNKELELTRKSTFTLNEYVDLGLGWFIKKQNSENRWHWHNGGTGGYRSSMALNSEMKNAVIILSNVPAVKFRMLPNNNAEHIDDLCFDLMQEIG
ncbi:serine hydrolase domain-containing protein [Alkalispirochaeta sphaeroplastigenens]|uniref:serine hydrolase domain-containing protein n=1 Tax=Alkalispirochaeta sphaeroplastigenens TaxID=1187066 RepID=UPI0015E1A79E|nr:serine hydrolase domain-containing protein [Alkalispirochaeta sphaeroplastigenens]